jgi:phage gpG-like protein
MSIGDVLIDVLTNLEDGTTTDASVSFKINSRDFKRTIKNLGHKIDNMNESFEFMGQLIQGFVLNHFENDTGPDQNGNMVQWPAYSDRTEEGKNWIDKKMKSDKNTGGDKLLHYTGKLKASLQKGGPGNIHIATNRRLEIGTDIPYAMYHQRGFDTISHGKTYPTQQETLRPVFGLTDEEEEIALDEFEKHFFKDL